MSLIFFRIIKDRFNLWRRADEAKSGCWDARNSNQWTTNYN